MSLARRVMNRVPEWMRWRPARRSMLLVGGALLAMLAGVATTLVVVSRPVTSAQRDSAKLRRALDALDRGSFVLARKLAKEILESPELAPDEFGGGPFVIGASRLREADQMWGQAHEGKALLASRYLLEAEQRGFPPGRTAEGLFLLGKSLLAGGRVVACRRPLLEAMKAGWHGKIVIHRLLADSYMLAPNPDYARALEHLSSYLDGGKLTEQQRTEGRIRQCQALLALGRTDACRQLLEALPDEFRTSRRGTVIRGQALLTEAQELDRREPGQDAGDGRHRALAKYREALQVLRGIQQRDAAIDRQAMRVAMYLSGVVLKAMGDAHTADALVQFTRVRKLFFETPEGFAASLMEADILRETERDADAVAAYHMTLSTAGEPERYSNQWVPLDHYRARLMVAYQGFAHARKFDRAIELASRFPPVFSRPRALELVARAASQWGTWMAEGARRPLLRDATIDARESRRHYRQAGRAYLRLARLRYATRQYPEDLWLSAQNLLAGQAYRAVVPVLKEYLTTESRRHRSEALLGIGMAYLALGDAEDAVDTLTECIRDHGRDPVAYLARLWCSKAYMEQNKPTQAEQLLRDNLSGDDLTPSSVEWRDSLYALGELLYNTGRFQEAADRLDEAIQRYPDTQQAITASYLLAETYRQRAREPQQRLRQSQIPSERLALRRQINILLRKATKHYSAAREILLRREQHAELTHHQRAILRNCYFAQGSVLFDLGQYDDAAEVYTRASTQYQNQPAVLEAYLKLSHCHRHNNEPVQARGAIEQAKVALQRLPISEPLEATTNYPRSEWASLLNQLSSR